jgi:glyoxylase-like metal-dependent hydrolase (beta-lactamase superfamily II)
VSAELDVLVAGYVGERVASTVSLIRDGDLLVVVDPGMVADRSAILGPLRARGIAPEAITEIVISHHHPDHTINIALFPNARVHDFMATYQADVWTDHEPGEFVLSPSIRLVPTPGHTDQDITTVVETTEGIAALTHLWWTEQGPADDPFADDRALLRASRELVLSLNPATIVPGHGAPFAPSAATPL